MRYNPPPLDQGASDMVDNAVQKLVTFFGMSTIIFSSRHTYWHLLGTGGTILKKDGSFYPM
jgi:hypothetical protein